MGPRGTVNLQHTLNLKLVSRLYYILPRRLKSISFANAMHVDIVLRYNGFRSEVGRYKRF
jgi:hypothetical protein